MHNTQSTHSVFFQESVVDGVSIKDIFSILLSFQMLVLDPLKIPLKMFISA